MEFKRKINDLITYFNNKQYSKLIFEIESNFDAKEINSRVLLLLGLARMKSHQRNFQDVLLALQNFKKGYTLDKKSKVGLECLICYLYGISEKVKKDNTLSLNEYKEIKDFFLRLNPHSIMTKSCTTLCHY